MDAKGPLPSHQVVMGVKEGEVAFYQFEESL